jgi:orotidine-5'-phosphate decarboxylase
MNYSEMLKESSEKNKSIVCMGADPVLEKIEAVIKSGDAEEKITKFYSEIIDACISENTMPAAIKPNYAFYAQHGWEGLRALKSVCEKVKEAGIPLIFDGKRGDIGKTSAAYAKELFDFWQADCATIAPYMGSDSVGPFIKYCEEKGKGVYILNRTSNAGAVDLQNLIIEGKPLFLKTAEKIVEWGSKANGNVGAVVGATSTTELSQLAEFYSAKKVPLLIPGVGSQGGSAEEVSKILKESKSELALQRINSSSEINFAFEKQATADFAGAAVKAIKELNRQLNF